MADTSAAGHPVLRERTDDEVIDSVNRLLAEDDLDGARGIMAAVFFTVMAAVILIAFWIHKP